MNIGDANDSSLARDLTGLQDPASVASFLEIAFDAVVTFDSQEQITYWNPAAEHMFGWTAQEARGKTPARLFWPVNTPEEKRERRQRQLKLKRGETLRGEYTFCHKDGSSLDARYVARAVFDAEGKLTGYLAIYRDISVQEQDITEPGRTEPQLEQNNQKLNEILASIQDDFYVLDRDWKFVYANRLFTSKVGKEPEDFIGNNIWKMFPKHIGTVLEENFRAAMEMREVRRFEVGGKYTAAWYRMTAFPSAEGITVLGTDITERKQMEEALSVARGKAERTADRIARLQEITTALSQTLTPPEVGKILVEKGSPVFGAASISVFLLSEDGQTLSMIYSNIPESMRREWGNFPVSLNVPAADAVRADKPIWIETQQQYLEHYPHLANQIQAWGHQAALAIPMLYKGRVLGVLTLSFAQPLPYSSEDERYILTLARQGAQALDRARAEQALRLNATMFENVAAGIYLVNAKDGTILHTNPNFDILFGYEPGEVIGKHDSILNAPTNRSAQETAEEIMTALKRDSVWQGEVYSIRKDGTPFWCFASISTFEHASYGNVWVAARQDITEHKRVEEQLRELSQRLTYHVDNSPLAVIEWGPDMRLIRWSAAAERIFGWKAEEVLGKRMEDFRWIYDGDAQHVNSVSSDLQTGSDPQRFSANRNYRKDGSVAYCEWYNSSLVDESGKFHSILSLVLDVTEKKQAEQALRESEERYRHLVKHAPAAIYEIDLKTTRFVEVNDGMCQMLGYTRDELLSMMPGELLDEESRGQFGERIVQTLAGEKISEQIVYKVKAKDGHDIWAVLNTTINYDNGKPKSVSVIAHDITERARAEEALRENERQLQLLNETLEQKIQEKTAEVRRLATDLTRAEQRQRHRISQILHEDLQQRLFAIQMEIALFREQLQKEDVGRDLTYITEQLNEILMVTRYLSIDLMPPILRDEGLLQAISWLASQMEEQHGLHTEVQGKGSFAFSDKDLQVLLFNCVRQLLLNIVQHAEVKEAVVTLQMSGNDLQIEVCDKGQGFPADTLEQYAFIPQVPDGDHRPGLGLATIRQQLSLFGGRINVKSEPGVGTQIKLVVPVPEHGW